MKVLIVSSGNSVDVAPFVKEQIESLKQFDIMFDFYRIVGNGAAGYLSNLFKLRKKIVLFKPDLIHAHYGLSGLLANLQRKVPVVTTFHGSDINDHWVYYFSRITHKLSSASIFVSENMKKKVPDRGKNYTIPCGIDLSFFKQRTRDQEINLIAIKKNEVNILFSSSFSNHVKNSALAFSACNKIRGFFGKKINIIELKGYNRSEVNQLLNEVDCLLLTSFTEGSPLIVKEAMACNCPIVSTDVGDVSWIFGRTDGCYVASFDPNDVAEKIKLAYEFRIKYGQTKGREQIIELGLDKISVAKKIIAVYEKVMNS